MPISGNTRLLGLLGWPVEHSFSPAMHNAAAAALGLDLAYVPLPTRPGHLPAALQGLAALGFLGVNVTVPHKQAVLPLLDELTPAGQAIGAVNSIKIVRDPAGVARLLGDNTDGAGFLADLAAQGVSPAGQECLVLGAGGAARAVAYALAQAGAQVHVLARRPEQAAALVADLARHCPGRGLAAHAWPDLAALSQRPALALVVNSTPLGMTPQPHASPWPDALPFPAGAVAYDLVYNPRQTRFMRQAQAAGSRAMNGLGMLVQQGALAFAWWTGSRPDVAVMRAAINHEKAG